MFRRISRVGVLLVVSGVVPGFFAGVATARTLFATSVNVGLANALSSVGQNLFGEAVFGVNAIPSNPITPSAGSVQMDVSTATQIPVSLNIFNPGNNIPGNPVAPCPLVAKIVTGPDGVVVTADPSVTVIPGLAGQGALRATSNVPAACTAPIN